METSKVIGIVQATIPSAKITIEGEDCSFTVCVISDVFTGLRTVARQQKVLSGFTELLKNGEIHALSVKAYTPQEWEESKALTNITLS